MKELNLYFDESGYTGENLLHEEQTTFVYSSINIDPDEAKNFVNNAIVEHKVQNGELKAVKLIRRERGKKLILNILDNFKDRIKISVGDKKFALCCKFFEYIFEPVLAEKNSIFYQLNFHKFISNHMYIGYITKDVLVIEIISIFENLMRKKDLKYLDDIINLADKDEYKSSKAYDFYSKILKFIKLHKNTIVEEFDGLMPWTADLTITSLNALFSAWGELRTPIVAYCDQSKPIDEQKEIFNGMLGREDIIYSPIKADDGTCIPITYNLKEINLVDSKEFHGVQLADIIATAAAYSMKLYQLEDDFISKARTILLPCVVYGSVMPNFDELDLNRLDVQLNAIIFEELIERSINNLMITNDIELYISEASDSLRTTSGIKI